MSSEGERFLGIDDGSNKLPADQGHQSVINNPVSGGNSKPRYPALRIIASIYRVLAVILAIAGLAVIVFGIAGGQIELILAGSLGATLGVITSLAAAEGIIVFLDIEENTRRANMSKIR